MEQYYKLDRVRELADNDTDFVLALAKTFIDEVSVDIDSLKTTVENKDYQDTYQLAHKMKPTIDLFELGVLDEIIEVQDWGKYQKIDIDIKKQFEQVVIAVDKALKEIKLDFNL